jgi:hypothetical protein
VSAPRARELPVGSVVALRTHAWVKFGVDHWLATGEDESFRDVNVQSGLNNGAIVLRVGDGSEL